MPQGLQIWDAAGTLILDTNQRVMRYIGTVTVSGNGSLTADFGGAAGWAIHLPHMPSDGSQQLSAAHSFPDVTFSGNTMSWTYVGGSTNVTTTLMYGAY